MRLMGMLGDARKSIAQILLLPAEGAELLILRNPSGDANFRCYVTDASVD